MVLICPSDVADAKMRIYNLDGSEGRMGGNAARCVGKYLYERGICRKRDLTLETMSGLKKLHLYLEGGVVTAVTVDMGKAELAARNLPIALDSERVIDVPVTIGEEEYRITGVSMGNPHCVVFQDNVDLMELDKIGPLFEYSPLFPERVNAEFVEVLGNNTLKIRVWERGSGETWACGTGACAAAVASDRKSVV